LWRREPRDDRAPFRPRRSAGAHPSTRQHRLDGTSLRSLCTAAEELGLAARSVKASPQNLDRMPLPAICHWDGDHWLLLYHVTRRHAYLADPAIGFRRVPRDEFERRWTGYAALFDYTPAFEQAPRAAYGFGWLWPIVKPHMPLLVRALALAASSACCRWCCRCSRR
jgi:ATP-binding cassette subfamily B protein